ncbi:MAG: 2TM domain-containing protein [Comamonadaceae bacterium]|nr:MAG: 2TM domain-containing protein [Comamonadaceae bacterium]
MPPETVMTPEQSRIESLAVRRARAKLGWYSHAAVYLVVNAGLIALSLAHGGRWAIFPLLGWGVGLLFHGLSVWMFQPGGELMTRMVDRERARLASNAGSANSAHNGDAW